MGRDVALILSPELVPAGPERTLATPFGAVAERQGALLRAAGVDQRALIYAAKDGGARRVLAGDVVEAVSPLLEPGDLVLPGDVIDQTRLRPFTFFEGKGYGFIKLNPAFCPDLLATLWEAAQSESPRVLRRATYVGAEGPRSATDAERRMYRHWGADVVGSGLLPEVYLARELELCYAAITVVGDGELFHILTAAAEGPHGGVRCACGETMAQLKAQGVVGEDWRTW